MNSAAWDNGMSLEIFQNEQFCSKEIESLKKFIIYMHDLCMIDFSCPECNFIAKGSGKVDADMVDNNNLSVLVFKFCKFSTKNNTSIYNHRMKYCRKIQIHPYKKVIKFRMFDSDTIFINLYQ